MEQKPIEEITLAIECAVGNGSVAVLQGVGVLATSAEDDRPSRAEEVLGAVKAILDRAALGLDQIDRIAVSTGPGSYSGIRIGMATALGLGNALGITPVGVSVLDATAVGANEFGRLVAAVAVGKRHTAWGVFDTINDSPTHISKPVLESDDEFISGVSSLGAIPLFWSAELESRLTDKLPANVSPKILRPTIAELIGIFSSRFPDRTSLDPQYLREQQAANAG